MLTRISFSLLISCAVLSSGCVIGGTTGPSPFFEVRGSTHLLVGAKSRLIGVYSRTGSTLDVVEVPVVWRSEGSAIAVAPDGTVTALHIGRATAWADSEFGRHGASVEVVATAAGTWRGTLTIAECRRETGEGPDPCTARRGAAHPVTLVISHPEAANTISGSVEVHWAPTATGWVSGQVFSSGRFMVVGRIFRTQADDLNAPFGFVAQLEGDHLLPEENRSEYFLTLKTSAGSQGLSELWQVSTLTRDAR